MHYILKNQYWYNYLLLFLPALAAILVEDPIISYLISWLGSFWIFYISMSGKIQPLYTDMPITQQLMRPIFITQCIFAGYLAVSSIFYFLDQNGYYFFTLRSEKFINMRHLADIAKCQGYYCFAHASYTTGILLAMKTPKRISWKIKINDYSSLLLRLSLIFTGLAVITNYIPGMMQFAIKLEELSFVAAVLSLALSIPKGKKLNIAIASSLFLLNMLNAFLSGWKEQIIVPLIMLGTYLYPYYKRTISLVFPVLIILFFVFIPTYNKLFRGMAWSNTSSIDSESAAKAAFESIRAGEEDLGANNWYFLTGRLSEIAMFTEYINRVPSEIDFYGFTIVKQSLQCMIPRILWPGKPITEELAMERVYEIGIVDRSSIVSAKTPLVIDGYLSFGLIGIIILSLLVGYSVTSIANFCENLFGGYLLGTGLIYTGLFQIFWRGNCFEFMLNSVFWSLVLVFLLFKSGCFLGIITKK